MSKLDFKEVSKELNLMFSNKPKDGQKRNIVFWFDGEGEFKDKLVDLDLKDAKILEFSGNNYFEIKYTLEVVDTTSNYLIYSPHYKPTPEYNYLLDICLYSQEFEADITTIYMRELGIVDSSLVETVKKYKDFLNSKERRNRLQNYNITNWTEQKMHIGVFCAVLKQNLLDFENALIVLFDDYINNGTMIDDVKKYCDIETLNEYIENKFGIVDAFNDLDYFITCLMLLHTSLYLKGTLPNAWKTNLPDTNIFAIKNNAYILIDRFMKSNFKDSYIEMANRVENKINFERLTKDWDIDAFIDVDTFVGYDKLIIKKLTEWLLNGSCEFERYLSIIKQRRKSFFEQSLKNEYIALHYATKFLSKVKEEDNNITSGNCDVLLKKYTESYYKFDQYYREFINAYDKVKDDSLVELFTKIENTYTNWYLSELANKWSVELKQIPYDSLNGEKQWNFYEKFIHRNQEKIAVIISDALRYECGEELNKRILNNFKVKTDFSYMLSTVPSYTALGMACLLPHNKIEYKGSDVFVDGINSATTENRARILNSYTSGVAYTYKYFKEAQNFSNIRSEITGKNVIYIYHNSIDAMGDNRETESNVFDACETCFDEIQEIVQRLQNLSITNVIITADHGFLYKRNDIKELNKTVNEIENPIVSKRRFVLSNSNSDVEMSKSISLNYLSLNEELNVFVPYGINIYKKQGESCKYVHGGDSLQEIVIPLIQIDNRRSKRDKYTAKNVTLKCVELSNKITSIITFISFFQNEKVSEKVLPKNYEVYFEDEQGNKISDSRVINADSKSEDVKDRMYKEKFTLRNQKYDKNKQYYLVIEDYDNEFAEKTKLPYNIDILIDNDFGL